MKEFLKDYFSFTRTETRIIIILSLLILIQISIRYFLTHKNTENYKPSEQEMKIVEEFIASLEFREIENKIPDKTNHKAYYNKLESFDPNTVLEKDMQNMGFPEKVISNISKYRKSGGYFYSPADVRKIYGMTDSAFILILPHINLMNSNAIENQTSQKEITLVNVPDLININTADSFQLISLYGIGPTFASRIIKYRNELGGFIRPDQLLEIYGMNLEKYNLFINRIFIDTLDIRKIDINTISFSDLIKHPYADEELTTSILKFRDFRGKINYIQELFSFQIANKEKLKKIQPYLYISKEE